MGSGLSIPVSQPPLAESAGRPAVALFAAFQDIFGAPQKIIPKSLMQVGLTMELFAHGEFSLVSSATASVGFHFGAAALTAPGSGHAILGQTQLLTPGAAAITSGHWQAYWRGKLRAIGLGTAGGTWKGRGWARLASTTTPFNTDVNWPIPTTLALSLVTCDVTQDRSVGPGWQWGTSAAGNTVLVDEFEARLTA
jgi:hypothetical protein